MEQQNQNTSKVKKIKLDFKIVNTLPEKKKDL